MLPFPDSNIRPDLGTPRYGTPSAKPASFTEIGIIFKVSSVERIIKGNIITASAVLPAKAEKLFVMFFTTKK